MAGEYLSIFQISLKGSYFAYKHFQNNKVGGNLKQTSHILLYPNRKYLLSACDR